MPLSRADAIMCRPVVGDLNETRAEMPNPHVSVFFWRERRSCLMILCIHSFLKFLTGTSQDVIVRGWSQVTLEVLSFFLLYCFPWGKAICYDWFSYRLNQFIVQFNQSWTKQPWNKEIDTWIPHKNLWTMEPSLFGIFLLFIFPHC